MVNGVPPTPIVNIAVAFHHRPIRDARGSCARPSTPPLMPHAKDCSSLHDESSRQPTRRAVASWAREWMATHAPRHRRPGLLVPRAGPGLSGVVVLAARATTGRAARRTGEYRPDKGRGGPARARDFFPASSGFLIEVLRDSRPARGHTRRRAAPSLSSASRRVTHRRTEKTSTRDSASSSREEQEEEEDHITHRHS